MRMPSRSKCGQAGHRNIVFDIPMQLLGFPQTPDRTQSVRSNTPAAWLFRSLRSLIPAHPRRKYEARSAPVKTAPGAAQIPHA